MGQIPLYELKPNVQRLMFAWYWWALFASILLFGIIVLSSIRLSWYYYSIIAVFCMVVVAVNLFIVYTSKSKISVRFYKDRIIAGSRILPLKTIKSINTVRTYLDSMYRTQTIQIDGSYIKGLRFDPRIDQYIKSLTIYAKGR